MVQYRTHRLMEEVQGFHKATKRRHRVTTCLVLPQRPPGDRKRNDDAICVHFADHYDGRGSAPVLYCAYHSMG
jgi:hypothetical protein